MEYIFIIFIISLIIYLGLSQFRVIYYRYLKSFDKEIIKYLDSNNYQIEETRTPNKNDWKKSPFKKPPNFEVSLSLVQINGISVTWTDYEYKVIEVKDKKHKIWLEIKTTYFQKPVLKFIIDK